MFNSLLFFTPGILVFIIARLAETLKEDSSLIGFNIGHICLEFIEFYETTLFQKVN